MVSEASYDIRALRKGVKGWPVDRRAGCVGAADSLTCCQQSRERFQREYATDKARQGQQHRAGTTWPPRFALAAGAFERYPAAPADTEERRPVVVG